MKGMPWGFGEAVTGRQGACLMFSGCSRDRRWAGLGEAMLRCQIRDNRRTLLPLFLLRRISARANRKIPAVKGGSGPASGSRRVRLRGVKLLSFTGLLLLERGPRFSETSAFSVPDSGDIGPDKLLCNAVFPGGGYVSENFPGFVFLLPLNRSSLSSF